MRYVPEPPGPEPPDPAPPEPAPQPPGPEPTDPILESADGAAQGSKKLSISTARRPRAGSSWKTAVPLAVPPPGRKSIRSSAA